MPITCYVWKVNPLIGNFGPISIRWYGLLLSISFLLGYILLYWQFKRGGRIANLTDFLTFLRLLIYLVVGIATGAYVSARIFYQSTSLSVNPLLSLSMESGLSGLSSHGAIFGCLTAAYIFHLQTKIPFLEILDRLAFSGATGIVLVRLGNLMNSECVGRDTALSWGFRFPVHDGGLIPRHPTQIYEAGIGMLLLLVLVTIDRRCGGEKRPLGLLAGVLLFGYFVLRFPVEFLKKGDVLSPIFRFTTAQFLSLPLMLLGLCLIFGAFKKRLPES